MISFFNVTGGRKLHFRDSSVGETVLLQSARTAEPLSQSQYRNIYKKIIP